MINNSNLKIYEINEDTVSADCKSTLRCKRGAFYPNKNFGSLIGGMLKADEILSAARQALAKIDGVFVKDASLEGMTAEISLLINDSERTVKIELEKNL